jgi:phospholipase/lecithinase/hemolysin
MLRPRLRFSIIALIATFLLGAAAQAANLPFTQLVVFGDSVSDVGNGAIIWGAFTPQSNYSNNRYTDGPDTTPPTSQPALIWTDELAAKLNLSAPTASLAGGTDYAATGATVTDGSAQYPSLATQVQEAIGRGVSPTALYAFWGGANDITNQTDPAAVSAAATAAAQNIGQQISELAAQGAKYFVWINMPPFDRIPGQAPNAELSSAFGQASIAYDQQQASEIAQLRNQYTSQGVIIASVDMYALFTSFMDNPAAYGFINATDNAADQPVDPDQYFFWQAGHFTTAGHMVVANEIYRVVQRVFSGSDRTGNGNSGPGNRKLNLAGGGRWDFTVWRPSNGAWYTDSNSNPAEGQYEGWGASSDTPVPGDYDGDGITDRAVWRASDGRWYIIPSSNPAAAYSVQWGSMGDIPAPGDYDGDGKTDIAIWRPSTGVWYIIPSSAPGAPFARQWGIAGDIPVPADYDGDGRTDFAVWRPSEGNWYIERIANSSATVQQWGMPGDVPVPGDYDGDGRTDLAVWRPWTGVWYVISSSSGAPSAVQWGVAGDIPVYGDYDGDGKTDYIIWRPANGMWWVDPSDSPSAPITRQWGANGDIPF